MRLDLRFEELHARFRGLPFGSGKARLLERHRGLDARRTLAGHEDHEEDRRDDQRERQH